MYFRRFGLRVMTINDVMTAEGYANGATIPDHYNWLDSIDSLKEELNQYVYSLKGGLAPIRTRIESLQRIDDDLSESLNCKRHLNGSAIDFVTNATISSARSLISVGADIRESRQRLSMMTEQCSDSFSRLCTLYENRKRVAETLRIVQAVSFSVQVLNGINRENLTLSRSLILSTLDSVPPQIYAVKYIKSSLVHVIQSFRVDLFIKIIYWSLSDTADLSNMYGSCIDETLTSWTEFEDSEILGKACEQRLMADDCDLLAACERSLERLSKLSEKHPQIPAKYSEYISEQIIKLLGIMIYRMIPGVPTVPSSSYNANELTIDELVSLQQQFVDFRGYEKFISTLPIFSAEKPAIEAVSQYIPLRNIVRSLPNPLPSSSQYLDDLEWLVFISYSRTILGPTLFSLFDDLINHPSKSTTSLIIDEIQNKISTARIDSSPTIHHIIASTILISISSFISSHPQNDVEGMISLW